VGGPISGQTIHDVIRSYYVVGAFTATTTPQPVRVGSENLKHRKVLIVHNNSSAKVWLVQDVTQTKTDGIPIKADERLVIGVTDNVDVYIVAGSGTKNLRVMEGA